jgi:hypothetical protein
MKLFALCLNMKWSHLPLPGGIYAQHPQLLEEFRIIFDVKNEHEQKLMEKNKADAAQRQASVKNRNRRR